MEILNKNKNKNGFTLIEVMIAITIFSITAVLVSDIYIQISKYYFNSLSNRAAQQNVKVAMETITRYTKQSSIANWDNSNKKLTVRPKDDLSGSINTVVFQLVSVSPTIKVIKMGINGATPSFLTSENLNISNFDVSYGAGVPAIVNITIEADVEGGNRATERGIGGNDKIIMKTATALKAQYNY
ncbi:MAG: type II secretion system protein [Candidatus Woesearchaeota archaeon]